MSEFPAVEVAPGIVGSAFTADGPAASIAGTYAAHEWSEVLRVMDASKKADYAQLSTTALEGQEDYEEIGQRLHLWHEALESVLNDRDATVRSKTSTFENVLFFNFADIVRDYLLLLSNE